MEWPAKTQASCGGRGHLDPRRRGKPGSLLAPVVQGRGVIVGKSGFRGAPVPALQTASIAKSAAAATSATAAPANVGITALPSPSAQSLFNGKDATGWQGDPSIWTVADGHILAQGGHNPAKARNGNSYFIHEGDYADFEMTLEFKLSNQGRSGVQFRSALNSNGQMQGCQVRIGFDKRGKSITGSLSEEGTGRNFLKNRTDNYRPGDWNKMSIRCEGDHIVIKINGYITVDFRDPQGRRSGVFALQSHGGRKPLIAFRNILVCNLTPAQARPVEPQIAKKPANDYETLATGRWDHLLATARRTSSASWLRRPTVDVSQNSITAFSTCVRLMGRVPT